MSLFSNLKNDGLEESEDRLGGFAALESDIYTGPIKMAYAGKSDSGARNITVILGLPGGKEHRETVYITNKKGENWYVHKDDKDKKKQALPGFTLIDDLCLVATGKPLAEQDAEDKMVKVYDAEQKKEVPKSVPVLTDLIGKEVSVAISKVLENKSVKEGNEYVATAETRTTNAIEKVFDTETKMTVAEARKGDEKGTFWDAWLERNKGQTRDKRTIKDGGSAGSAGRPGSRAPSGPPQAGAAQTGRKSLFGNKSAAA